MSISFFKKSNQNGIIVSHEKMDGDDSSTELLFEYECGGVDSISNPKKQKQANHMDGNNVINLSNIENMPGSGASFHTDSELFEPPLINPTLDPPSTTWIPPLEEQHETTAGVELQAPAGIGDNDPQLNVVYDPSQHGVFGHETSNPSNENLELGSSAGSNGSFLENANSNQNFRESTHSRFEVPKSPFEDGTNARRTELSSFFTPAMPNLLRQEENIPENTTGILQMLYSGNEVNPVQQNQLHSQYSTGNTLHAVQLLPQQTETLNLGSSTTFATQFGAENMTNCSINSNEQVMPYLNALPQSSTMGIGLPNGRSTSTNQQSPNTLLSNYQNDLYRPLVPSGSQMHQFIAPNNFDTDHSNLMLPRPSADLRPPLFNNHQQLLNQVSVMPNAFSSQLQPQLSMATSFRSQHFLYQHNQLPLVPRGYHENMLPELSMSLRSPTLPQHHQVNQELNRATMMPNPLDPMYSNPMMLSRPQPLLDHQQMISVNLPNSRHHNSEFPGALFPSVSDYQQLNQASGAPNMTDFEFQNSFLHNPSMPSRLQTMQHQGLLNQTTRPVASYPGPVTSLSNLVFETSALPEIVGFNSGLSVPQQIENSTINNQGDGAQQGQARSIVELGESPTFKRFRRESNRNSLFPQVEAPHPNSSSFFPSRHMKNLIYDPIFEGIGLPIDPHLRLFDNSSG